MFPERLESSRLRYLQLARKHIDVLELYEICSSDDSIGEVTRHLPWGPHSSPKATLDYIEDSEQRWNEARAATYVIFPKECEDGGDNIAGITSLSIDWDLSVGTVGIWLRRPFWGRGYSEERALTLCKLAFTVLNLEFVEVSVQEGNEKSNTAVSRYVKKFGGQYEGLLRNIAVERGSPVNKHRYTIGKDEFCKAVLSNDE